MSEQDNLIAVLKAKVERLEKQNKALKENAEKPCGGCQMTDSLEESLSESYDRELNLNNEINALKAQNRTLKDALIAEEQKEVKMRCCENCKSWVKSFDEYCICSTCENLNKWELAE